MVELISVKRSTKPDKKLEVKLETDQGRTKTLNIGQKGAPDFTKTGDEEQKARYIDRHKAREDWKLSGILTAGFWSKNLLWNKPTLEESIKDVKEKYGV
jgi:hypothetical protein